jgi:hypothetical protein
MCIYFYRRVLKEGIYGMGTTDRTFRSNSIGTTPLLRFDGPLNTEPCCAGKIGGKFEGAIDRRHDVITQTGREPVAVVLVCCKHHGRKPSHSQRCLYHRRQCMSHVRTRIQVYVTDQTASTR